MVPPLGLESDIRRFSGLDVLPRVVPCFEGGLRQTMSCVFLHDAMLLNPKAFGNPRLIE